MNRKSFLQAGVILGTSWAAHQGWPWWSSRASSSIALAGPGEFAIRKSEAEWQQILTPEQFYVLREHGTEYPGSSPLVHQEAPGTYVCAGCAQAVFTSQTKFNSGTGWPSFYEPIPGSIGTEIDRSWFMTRIEVHCARCGGHLGHVFEDGPPPTGQRYCINGVALKFVVA